MAEWENSQIESLVNLYKENDIPTDELISDENAFCNFVEKLNERLGDSGNFSNDDVAKKLFRLRKSKKLPKLRR